MSGQAGLIATYVLVGLTVAAALWAVLANSLLRAAIGLALTSALLTAVMFQMDAPLAGVFELSVCAGLITVVFVSTISLTRPSGEGQAERRREQRAAAFKPLLAVVAVVFALLWTAGYALDVQLPAPGPALDVRQVLWSFRRVDLLGQILVILVGAFGVVILFKERKAVPQTLKEAALDAASPGGRKEVAS